MYILYTNLNMRLVTDMPSPVSIPMIASPPSAFMISDSTALTAVSGVSSTVPTLGCRARNTTRENEIRIKYY